MVDVMRATYNLELAVTCEKKIQRLMACLWKQTAKKNIV